MLIEALRWHNFDVEFSEFLQLFFVDALQGNIRSVTPDWRRYLYFLHTLDILNCVLDVLSEEGLILGESIAAEIAALVLDFLLQFLYLFGQVTGLLAFVVVKYFLDFLTCLGLDTPVDFLFIGFCFKTSVFLSILLIPNSNLILIFFALWPPFIQFLQKSLKLYDLILHCFFHVLYFWFSPFSGNDSQFRYVLARRAWLAFPLLILLFFEPVFHNICFALNELFCSPFELCFF